MKQCVFVCLTCVLLAMILTGCMAKDPGSHESAGEGVIDLTAWDFETQGNVRLDGQWAFYWQRFTDPASQTSLPADTYIDVPGVWSNTVMGGRRLPGTGYATYRLHVETSLPRGTQVGLRLFTFSSAYRLYVDDTLVARNGSPSSDASGEIGEYRPQAVYFSLPDSAFDITVHVSNHAYARGGFWYSAFLGEASRISALHDGIMQKEAFLLGALVIILLFYLALYLMRREFVYLLVFACFCAVLLIVLNMVGQLSIVRFFTLRFDTMVCIWYSSVAWAFFFLYLYIHTLYTSALSRLLLWVFGGLTLLLQLVYLCTPVLFYSAYFADPSSFFNIILVAGAVLIIILGIRTGQDDGWLNLTGIFVAALTYIHDDMFWTNIINPAYGEIHHFGLLFFLFMQTIIQAKRTGRCFEKRMAAELARQQAQIKPHFLYNVLNTIISVSHYDIDKARELLTSFSDYLRRSFDFKNQSQMVNLKNEIELSKAYVRIEQARFEERLEVSFDIGANTEAMVPMLVLQPVIENAVHHGLLPKPEGGRIDVQIGGDGRYILFQVTDNGVGMNHEDIDAVLTGQRQSGVGLVNIHERLKRLYGKGLAITSAEGEGTQVSWSVPVYGKWRKR